ncbi:unnamed protein product [Acanthoscelides obtectus]|uniref:Uncharacterized protein n=1 Tax=Acanthoscelides obtectus TaxID=200917 RepID=A0A9P0P0G3_ACAOB|nr:unnamed protein product [Acanthoscelides obtectus]CAK1620269.1 hypothetical protein AOBTE_LOCUS269 [Acanthoscelides obtectus]
MRQIYCRIGSRRFSWPKQRSIIPLSCQLTSTLGNISLVSEVAYTFKVGFPFRLIYSSAGRFGFRIPICVQSITPTAT